MGAQSRIHYERQRRVATIRAKARMMNKGRVSRAVPKSHFIYPVREFYLVYIK